MKTRISLIEYVRAIPDLSTGQRCMMYTLASYANADGTSIYPSHALLSQILGISTKQVGRLIKSLEDKGHLIADGKHGYSKKYCINISDASVQITNSYQDQTNISLEEWESQFLSDEELQGQGLLEDQVQTLEENQGMHLPPPDELEEDNDPTQPMPIIKQPPETPPPIVGRLPIVVDSTPPGEKLERDIEVLRESANLVLKGILKYDAYIRGGRRKGFSDDFLEMMLGGNGSLIGSQPGEPSITTIPLENIVY